jgi:crossover junction endonuclease MUS81
VLDCIVERKTIADLVGSIKDGRQHEQRHRLSVCGLRRVMYIIERDGGSSGGGDGGGRKRFGGGGGGYGGGGGWSGSAAQRDNMDAAIKKTLTSLDVEFGFLVTQTPTWPATQQFLAFLTRELVASHADARCFSQRRDDENGGRRRDEGGSDEDIIVTIDDTYALFATRNKRTRLTLSNLFGVQLQQITGVSADRAVAIIREYPTVAALCAVYARCGTVAAERGMLTDLQWGALNKKCMGAALSAKIRDFFRLVDYDQENS